jgi:hypothetical protein
VVPVPVPWIAGLVFGPPRPEIHGLIGIFCLSEARFTSNLTQKAFGLVFEKINV